MRPVDEGHAGERSPSRRPAEGAAGEAPPAAAPAATGPRPGERPFGPLRRLVGAAGEAVVYGLIRLFGRTVHAAAVPWLDGPVGGEHIGDRPYEEYARAHGLTLTRNAAEGGLIPSMEALRGPAFDPAGVPAGCRDFYEHTAAYRIDVWTRTWFPANLALWLLVTTISRRVDQLNFPVDALEAARGVDSEIVLLGGPGDAPRLTGWFRRLVGSGRVLYTGFYGIETIPGHPSPCVKVIFPMPHGNATVILRPEVRDGAFRLDTTGRGFGDVGFYRLQRTADGRLRVWRIRSLVESFELRDDPAGVLRCDHRIRFLGLPVLHIHYRMERKRGAAAGGA